MASNAILLNTILAARELRLSRMASLALYRLGLRSGHYRRTVNARLAQCLADGVRQAIFRPVWNLPSPADLSAVISAPDETRLLAQAEEIISGQARLFGAAPAALQLVPPGPLRDWTAYESGAPEAGVDIKRLWEPARFGWAFLLGRAYCLTGDERFPQAFWQYAEAFLDANPPFFGPNWASAQEAALRLIALTFALQIFQPSPYSRPERQLRLLHAIAVHAGRIPPTLVYARAQDNNHLLSEAAGLATAAALLPAHPQAARWRELGWAEFRRGLRTQIAPDGAYSQHSANYHRLMLQLGVWMARLSECDGPGLDEDDRRRLAAATEWLLALLDPADGRVPNLGPNDGAYIFPFSILPPGDYRPALQAAGLAFLGQAPVQPGAWDEMSLWFPSPAGKAPAAQTARPASAGPCVLRAADGRSWAYLRAARFTGRPGHADQLHLDLWRDGANIALDAGTSAYNAPPPWDNSLTVSTVHNTVTIDGLDQMRRVGRFLYLDWAQAEILDGPQPGHPRAATARHNGYRRLGLTHQRRVQVDEAGSWEIIDTIDGPGWNRGGADRTHSLALHWLLPDWPWQARADAERRAWEVALQGPSGRVNLSIRVETAAGATRMAAGQSDIFQVVRAGAVLYGGGPLELVLGWASPTYSVKTPALAVRCIVTAGGAARLITRFTFEDHTIE